MTRGLNRVQIGLTEEMVEAYGETVWDLSHNIQVRIGDPVRMLDWEQIEAQRDGAGLADVQIAERIGLTREQVTHIRLLLEHRKFQRHHYHRLYELGGGRRFRAERFVPVEARASLGERAMALRAALGFDAGEAERHIRTGRWGAATPASRLRALAGDDGGGLAIDGEEGALDWRAALERALSLAAGLAERGIGRGDVVATDDLRPSSLLHAYAAASLSSAVLCPLPDGLKRETLRRCLEKVSARVLITRGDAPSGLDIAAPVDALSGPVPKDWDADAVASDPLAILFAGLDGATPRASVHNAHTLLAGNDWASAPFRALAGGSHRRRRARPCMGRGRAQPGARLGGRAVRGGRDGRARRGGAGRAADAGGGYGLPGLDRARDPARARRRAGRARDADAGARRVAAPGRPGRQHPCGRRRRRAGASRSDSRALLSRR